MQSINSFINLLGKNYYSDFLINVNSETIDFDSFIILVNYKGTYFYELNNAEILIKRKEVIIEIKEHYQQALNEIYAMMLSQEPSKLNSFLDFNIKTIKSHLNILKKDFYIDSNQSRYYSILDDNQTNQDLETVYQEFLKSEEIDIKIKDLKIITNSYFKKTDSLYYLGFLYQRYKTLSFLPFALFQIGKQFILELNGIQRMINKDKEEEIKPIVKSFKEDYLEAFCKEISNERDIYKSTFIQCFEFGIKSFTEFLKSEITENLLVLPSEKIKPYLNYVEDKIKRTPYFGTDKAIIDKWITKYSIVDIEFPFLENEEVDKLITNYINNHLWNDKERALMEEIQLDFFYYASMMEANDIISFMDKLSFNETKSNRIIEKKSEINSKFNVFEKESELNSIFKSSDAFNTFNSLLDNFDINLSNVKKRGTQAKLNAIWGCPSSKKAIFKEHSELNEYVKYLNEIFKTKYNSRTMSDGSKYHSSIKEWLSPVK